MMKTFGFTKLGMTLRVATLAVLIAGFAGGAAAQTLAYVADDTGVVHVIDTATNAVIATVPTGAGPEGVTATPSGAFVYVANSAGNTVSVISVATNTVIATVPVAAPSRIAFTPNGAFAYVSSSALVGTLPDPQVAEVYVIDTAKQKVVATIPTGQGLSGIAVTSDGAFVWVGSEEGLFVIDTATNTVTATITDAPLIAGLAITPDGAFVYAAGVSNDEVVVYSTATHALVADIALPFPVDVAITPGGAFAYVPLLFGDVAVIDTATNTVAATVAVTPPVDAFLSAIALTPNGAFAYVTDTGGSVTVIDTATNTVTATVPVGTSLAGIDILVKPASPTSKDQCKNGGWATFTNPSFASQGACIKYVNGL